MTDDEPIAEIVVRIARGDGKIVGVAAMLDGRELVAVEGATVPDVLEALGRAAARAIM